MALLDDIASARNQVLTRANRLVDNMRLSHGVSFDNADQVDSWEGRWVGADKARLNQLDLLANAIADPAWTAHLDREAEARREAGNAQADASHRQAEDQRRVRAARSGTAASSMDAVMQEENRQRLAMAKATVAQQVSELRAAGVRNLEEMGRQLLDKILAGGDDSEAMAIQRQADNNRYAIDHARMNNDAMYRDLLANTLAGFVSNTVLPAVTSGFQAADRWNNQMREDYRDARDAGIYTGPYSGWAAAQGGERSWWRW